MLNTNAHIVLRFSSLHHGELGSMALSMRRDLHLDGR